MSNIAYIVSIGSSSYNACDSTGHVICGVSVQGEYCSSTVNGDSFTICVKDRGSQCFFTYDSRGTLIGDYSLPLDEPQHQDTNNNYQNTNSSYRDISAYQDCSNKETKNQDTGNCGTMPYICPSKIQQIITIPFDLLNLFCINAFICTLYNIPDPISVISIGMFIWTMLCHGHRNVYHRIFNIYKIRAFLYGITFIFFIISLIVNFIRI